MRRFSPRVLAALFSVLILSLLASCSGTGTPANPVTSITFSPLFLSLSPGQTAQLTGITKNYAGSTIVADVNYSSSNTNLVTITATGLVCAGLWDANFITCNALRGQSAVGQATITATSGTATATAAVYTHLNVDRIFVNPTSGCVSVGATPTYAATVYNITAPGCSANIPCDITSTVGPINFTSTDLTVMGNNVTSGVLTANSPGATSIFASVSGLNSTPQPALVCPVASINIHDASGSGTSFNLAVGGTQNLVADVIDTNGVAIKPTITWGATPLGSATVATTPATSTVPTSPVAYTVTSVAPGTAIITATCSTPNCNRNVGPQYGQNVVTVTTSGGSAPTVYAASTNSLTLVPITSSNNTVGTAITLPYTPNSMVSNSAGSKLYLGSNSGLMTVDTATSAVSVSVSIPGTVLAASSDGGYLFISDQSLGNVDYYDIANSRVIVAHPVTSSSAGFTPDSKSLSFVTGQTLYYDTTVPSSNTTNLPYTPTAIDLSAQGGLMYITSSAAGAIDIRSTCTQGEWQTLAATSPTLVARIPNGTGAVVVDSPSVDVVNTGALSTGCPTTAHSTVNTYNLGIANFNARQVFFSPDSSRAWVISDATSVVAFNMSSLSPTAVTLANGAQAYNGGITNDGAKVYVGGSDTNVHMLDVSTGTDSAQIAVGLKDLNSNVVAPNLVVVLPK